MIPVIEVDEEQLAGIRSAVGGIPGALPRIVSRAINKVISHARAEATRSLASDTGLKGKDIRKRLLLNLAHAKRLSATLSISRKRIPLIEFGSRTLTKAGKYAGFSYRVKKGEKRTKVRYNKSSSEYVRAAHSVALSAGPVFLGRMKTGHVGYFTRAKGWKISPRLPIVELKGPSLGHVMVNKIIVHQVLAVAGVRLADELQQQLKVFIQQSLMSKSIIVKAG